MMKTDFKTEKNYVKCVLGQMDLKYE